jgi:RHS repeat-associated protein
VTKTVSGTTRRFYYSDQWQILEEYLGSVVNPEMRYWYGLRDINDIARRQRYSSGTTVQDDLYALRETMNVVALVNPSGTATQRMAYDAFGAVRFLNSAFGSGSNAADWNLLFHGHHRDADTGLYQMRFRYYQPNLGVWLSRDPIGERGGLNLYGMCYNNALSWYDALGREPQGGASPAPAPLPGGGSLRPGTPPNSNCLGHACGSGKQEFDWEAVKTKYNCTKIKCPMTADTKPKDDCKKKPCKEGQHQIRLYGDKGDPKSIYDHYQSQEDDGQWTSQDGAGDPANPGNQGGPIYDNIDEPTQHWLDYWKKRKKPLPTKPYYECYCCDKPLPPK